MDYEKMKQLNDLYQSGAINREEFEREKQKIMDTPPPVPDNGFILNMSLNTYLGLMNFIVLAPSFGWILAIVAWILGKDKSPLVDQQGKNIINWMISWCIYGFAAVFLVLLNPFFSIFSLTGGLFSAFALVFFYIIVIALLIIPPIIAGAKGLKGETWAYPLTITFIK